MSFWILSFLYQSVHVLVVSLAVKMVLMIPLMFGPFFSVSFALDRVSRRFFGRETANVMLSKLSEPWRVAA